MLPRMLQLLGGLLAIAALVVAPSAASGEAGPNAKTAGNGNSDQYPPSSQWGNDWWGQDGNGRYWNGWGDGNGYFDGSSNDRGGNGSQHGNAARKAGKVDRVVVAVKRLRGNGKCQHLFRVGLSRQGSCTGTHWMRAKGTSSWRFDIPRSLPAGRYRLQRRAVDAAGNRERTHLLHLSIR